MDRQRHGCRRQLCITSIDFPGLAIQCRCGSDHRLHNARAAVYACAGLRWGSCGGGTGYQQVRGTRLHQGRREGLFSS